MDDGHQVEKATYFLVMAIKTRHPAKLKGSRGLLEVEMDLVWADGMVGCMPVFCDFESAQAYADGRYQILMVQGETVQ